MPRSPMFTASASLSLALVLALAGCSGGTQGGSGSAKDGGFSVAVGEPDHLTPGRSTVGWDQLRVLFAPLVKVDQQGKVSYVQARSVTSADAKHWTIKLRSGWTFHNGEAVTAQSYADAWNATAYGPNGWAANGQLAGIEGYAALNPAKGTPKTKTLSGVQVVDATTLKVTLTSPDSQFPLQLTPNQTGFYPMPKAAFTNPAAYDKKPIGNGPFKMTSAWTADKGTTVSDYAAYKGTKPKSSAITFKSYTDLNTAYTDALAGNTDVIGVPVSKYGQVKADFGDRVFTYEAPSLEFMGLPLFDKRFQDVRLRKALSMAIDRSAVNKAIYGGLYTPATSLTPPSEVGAETDLCDACTYDPTEAKKLLAEAGGWSGELTITYPGGLGLDELYKAVANQIRQNLGIDKVTAQPTADWAEFSEKVIGKKVTGLSHAHWGALYPSMQNTLRGIFTKAGGCVCSNYSAAAVDTLLRQADSETDAAAAQRLYNDVQKRILQDFPVIPLFYGSYIYAATDRVSGVTVGPADVELTQIAAAG
ncbi:peptide ABC transporter substrate-binding protein [Streptomyces pseudovenezuelae]|uniref:Oligopeptide transport system substrate-binding protein n=1 Tax=Streptomyces pseudovenezuelae TaxID=67350 RepID=A0ABT6LCL8_9ACTN|nr:ABC transporter substrate-binding protein [Streptomyces pseudovenezuelae]MDH6214053.1 oligopeptide transport system substrate-binding protein [Streptomyces pseudovenezuelae]